MTPDVSWPAWPLRFKAYLDERFKPGTTVVTTGMMVAAHGLAAHAVAGVAPEPAIAGRLGLVTLVLVLMFFHLRVFDEHKDHAIDRVAYPGRVLSRGWVTLEQLRSLAIAAIALELGLAALVGGRFLLLVSGCIGYTLLMLREFGIGPWLRRHLFVYGLSHMAILYGMVLAIYASLPGLSPASDPFAWPLLGYAGVGYGMVFSLEVARKVWHPDDEKPGVDSYSGRIGIPRAVATLVAFQGTSLILLAALSGPLHLHTASWLSAVAAWALAVGVLVTGVRKGQVDGYPRDLGRRVEAVAAVPVLVFNLALIIDWGMFR
jgi:4-hydroxybenzoate polyprenyltransferase